MITNEEMLAVLDKHRGDAVVVCTMSATRTWVEMSRKPSRDVPLAGSMGKAASFGLGLALARPDVKVVVLDADGSLLMNLGALATVAGKQPRNLFHFVLENGVYAITGGQPIPAKDRVCFAEIAKGAGYAATYEFENLEDLAVQMKEILGQEGPVFVTIKSVPEVQNEPIGRRARSPRMRTTPVALAALREELGTT